MSIKIASSSAFPIQEKLKLENAYKAEFLTSYWHYIFPDLTKTALVLPLDKWKPDKNEISNLRPLSILSTFSKIYERDSETLLLQGMENFRKFLRIKKNLIRLIEEFREYPDEDFAIGVILTDLSNTFDFAQPFIC